MLRKTVIVFSFLILLIAAVPTFAGGWVVITLEDLPVTIRAGEPLELSFMIRQHGEKPTHAANPILEAHNASTGKRIRIEAEKAQELGRYTATITFPDAGVWEWSISAEPFPQTAHQAPLSVLESVIMEKGENNAAPEVSFDQMGSNSAAQILRWGGVLLLGASGILFILDNRKDHAAAIGD